ncbi:hypothetical protein [Spirillospora sp. NPDC029432]|uniref:hypothetical protein n=1 Tax=Spirillospora sp. NPDC029432 TaxID=3154599 RepID=UPI00345450B4
MRGPLQIIASAVAGGVLALVAFLILDLAGPGGGRDIVARDTQPRTVKYDDGSVHHAGIVRVRTGLPGLDEHYELYTGRDTSMGYGHFVRLEFTGADAPAFKETRWEPAGFRARLDSGHEVFVPARYFMSGR